MTKFDLTASVVTVIVAGGINPVLGAILSVVMIFVHIGTYYHNVIIPHYEGSWKIYFNALRDKYFKKKK